MKKPAERPVFLCADLMIQRYLNVVIQSLWGWLAGDSGVSVPTSSQASLLPD
jgi:hypothetical protein